MCQVGDKIYDLDIVMPGEEGVVPGVVEKNEGVEYIRLDVRKLIYFKFTPTSDDIIFNLAAVHRTSGHPDKAYFETNIRGAENAGRNQKRHDPHADHQILHQFPEQPGKILGCLQLQVYTALPVQVFLHDL